MFWSKLFFIFASHGDDTHLFSFRERVYRHSWLAKMTIFMHWIALDLGHFSCGNRKCNERDGLRSWEVNFAYVEEGEKKNALVKLRKSSEYVSVFFLDGTFVTLKTDNFIISSICMNGIQIYLNILILIIFIN